MEQVRSATAEDVNRLVELTAAFHDATLGRRGSAHARPGDVGSQVTGAVQDVVAGYVGTSGHAALVGLLDGWTAGAALCRIDDVEGDRRGVLDVCFVEPGARGVGLGQLLIERSLEWFRDEGCTGVDGTAFPGDREAKQFFESAGFKARLLVMYLPLD